MMAPSVRGVLRQASPVADAAQALADDVVASQRVSKSAAGSVPSRDGVAFVLKDLRGGGAERMVLRLAAGVAEAGASVDLVVYAARGELLELVGPPVRLVDLGTGRASRSVLSLARYLHRKRPAVMYSTLRHTIASVALARRLSGLQVGFIARESNHLPTELTTPRTLRDGAFARAVHWAYRSSDLVTAVSNGVADQLRAFLGRDAPPVETRYNPVIGARLRGGARAPARHRWLRGDQHRPVIVAAGRLVPQKDHRTLIRAFARVRGLVPARLIIFGDGPERGALQDLVAELGLTGEVDLPGFEADLIPELAAASAFALSSSWEGLPGALIEALACGLPVVSTDCPSGPSEILQCGRWGRLVPVGDGEALADALVDALEGRVPRADPEAVRPFFEEDAIARCLEDCRRVAP